MFLPYKRKGMTQAASLDKKVQVGNVIVLTLGASRVAGKTSLYSLNVFETFVYLND